MEKKKKEMEWIELKKKMLKVLLENMPKESFKEVFF